MPTWTEEQKQAIYKSGKNLLVSAGAGSGKTAVLTTRVLEKLNQGIHINELLILTFTKAAAGEMKERIRKLIKKNSNLKKELSLLDTSYITTFDAFSLSIVKKYHYLLNITANPTITDDTILQILKKDTLRQTLDLFYKKNDSDFFDLINDFCVKNDEELYICLLNIANKLNDLTLEKLLKTANDTSKMDTYIRNFEKLLNEKQNQIKRDLIELSRIAPKDYVKKCYDSLSGLLNAQDVDTFILYRSCKMPSLPKNSIEEVKLAKEKTATSLKELLKLLDFGDENQLRKDYLQMQKKGQVLLKIIKTYQIELKKKKEENQFYDFHDIAMLAIQLVRDYPEVRKELKKQFREIMIDEYQDTNDLQETLIDLFANQNIYMVGDIKQSIYRFRDANPYLFKQKYDQYKTGKDGEKIDLNKNFRSREEVLHDINLIFNLLMNDELGGANYLEEHQMLYGNKSYSEKGKTNENYHMELLCYEENQKDLYSKDEIEAFCIGKDIKEKIKKGYLVFDKDANQVRKATYQDFVILMDRGTNFNLYKKIFNFLNIPICIQREETLNNSICFYVIKNIIYLVNAYQTKQFDELFRHALTSVARSFLFEYSDKLIFHIIKNHTWYQNTIYETLKPIIETVSTLSIPEIIDEIYKQTNIYENIIKIGDIEENMAILSHLKKISIQYSLLNQTISGFYEFLNRIKKEELSIKYITKEEKNDSVQIMTIHKSKGLEFPICYFSGLYKSFNITETKDKFLYDKVYGMITPLKEEGIYSCFVKELMRQNYFKEEISEKIRLFYVAVTRAKEKMIFVLPNNSRHIMEYNLNDRLKCKSFADFLYCIWKYLKPYQKLQNIQDLSITKEYLETLEMKEEIINFSDKIEVKEIDFQIRKEEKQKYSKVNIELNTKEEYQNIKLGIKIHEYLEWIDFENPNYDLIEEDFLREKIKRFIELPFIQDNITKSIYKEYEFIYEKDAKEYHGIIDLLIENETEILLIDYKLNNIVDKSYLNQLKGYQEYVQTKTTKPIFVYLYSILNEELKLLD